jgi:glycerophosphoryl diester phosphodiesterase
MPFRHPDFPAQRPLAIAHRAGNSLALAQAAIAAGADMLETDVWAHRSRLEVRHAQRLWHLPLLWDNRRLVPAWRHQFELKEMLQWLPITTRLFLDLKGLAPSLGERVVDLIEQVQPERQIVLCGRTWALFDAVADHPRVSCFYSIGDARELAAVWGRLETMSMPAVSLQKDLPTTDVMARLNALNTTVICWTVNDLHEARRLHALGVDGFTSDNLDLIERIVQRREMAMVDESPRVPNSGE